MADTASKGGFGAWLLDPKRRGALLVAPAISILFVMNIFPLMWSFGLSFFNYKASSLKVPRFKGLDNYERVLTDEKVWEHVSNKFQEALEMLLQHANENDIDLNALELLEPKPDSEKVVDLKERTTVLYTDYMSRSRAFFNENEVYFNEKSLANVLIIIAPIPS